MNLKTASLIAIIGNILMILNSIYYLKMNFEQLSEYPETPIWVVISNAVALLGWICSLVFFITLYSKQK